MPLQPLDFGALHKAVGRWAELNIERNQKEQERKEEEKKREQEQREFDNTLNAAKALGQPVGGRHNTLQAAPRTQEQYNERRNAGLGQLGSNPRPSAVEKYLSLSRSLAPDLPTEEQFRERQIEGETAKLLSKDNPNTPEIEGLADMQSQFGGDPAIAAIIEQKVREIRGNSSPKPITPKTSTPKISPSDELIVDGQRYSRSEALQKIKDLEGKKRDFLQLQKEGFPFSTVPKATFHQDLDEIRNLLPKLTQAVRGGQPAGQAAQEEPQPMPATEDQLETGKSYTLPNGEVGIWNGNEFELPD